MRKKRIYSIIHTNHGKRIKTLCTDTTENKIYKRLNALLKENENVIFPVMYNVEEHVMIPSDHELIILKRSEFGDKNETKVRDDSGKFVIYETSHDKWIVVDRVRYNVEEKFWVYGYHPRLQRKTFQWIYDEMVINGGNNKYMFKTIALFHNKILIESNDTLELVICKNKNDSIRFFNKLEEWCKRDKVKYIAFLGDIKKSKYKSDWIDKIKKLTGWNTRKALRLSTRD